MREECKAVCGWYCPVCTTVNKGSPRSLFLLTLGLLFEKALHRQGFKCMFHWPEWFLRDLSSPSCKSHGRVFLAGHSAEGIILDSATKKDGGRDLDRKPALSDTRCKD